MAQLKTGLKKAIFEIGKKFDGGYFYLKEKIVKNNKNCFKHVSRPQDGTHLREREI